MRLFIFAVVTFFYTLIARHMVDLMDGTVLHTAVAGAVIIFCVVAEIVTAVLLMADDT